MNTKIIVGSTLLGLAILLIFAIAFLGRGEDNKQLNQEIINTQVAVNDEGVNTADPEPLFDANLIIGQWESIEDPQKIITFQSGDTFIQSVNQEISQGNWRNIGAQEINVDRIENFIGSDLVVYLVVELNDTDTFYEVLFAGEEELALLNINAGIPEIYSRLNQ